MQKQLLVIYFLTLMSFFSCKKESSQPTVAQNFAVKMQVNGMTCESCSRGIKGTLGQYKEIKNIEIKVKEGLVSFDLIGNVELTDAKIKSMISDMGYQVKAFDKSVLANEKTA